MNDLQQLTTTFKQLGIYHITDDASTIKVHNKIDPTLIQTIIGSFGTKFCFDKNGQYIGTIQYFDRHNLFVPKNQTLDDALNRS